MNLFSFSAFALVCACVSSSVSIAQRGPAASAGCDVHVYPADGLHSVGEDFDAVKRVDQDIKDLNRVAGRDLAWLSPPRQAELLGAVSLGPLLGVTEQKRTAHDTPLSRREAVAVGPRTAIDGCLVELMLPQIMLERGGLAARSLRLFGVMRHYENGALVRSYSGYASAPLTGFKLKTAEDAPAATALIESAYRQAVETVARNAAAKSTRPTT